MDYGSGPYTVIFPAGMTRTPFDVPTTDDMILENNENFTLTIDSTTLPTVVIVGVPGEALITIVDDEGKSYLFSYT